MFRPYANPSYSPGCASTVLLRTRSPRGSALGRQLSPSPQAAPRLTFEIGDPWFAGLFGGAEAEESG